ncbi:MAG: YitT family protein [Planctomycetes bacterium]|jgi:uncharacterized membrane-anchored protein YitT (DUF2179 family)|nr:YitT family protein [Planctomycetota bacterium]
MTKTRYGFLHQTVLLAAGSALSALAVKRILLPQGFLSQGLTGVTLLLYRLDLNDKMLSAGIAGALCGTGSALVLRSRGSTGGAEILYVLMYEAFSLSLGTASLLVNAMILAAGGAHHIGPMEGERRRPDRHTSGRCHRDSRTRWLPRRRANDPLFRRVA